MCVITDLYSDAFKLKQTNTFISGASIQTLYLSTKNSITCKSISTEICLNYLVKGASLFAPANMLLCSTLDY